MKKLISTFLILAGIATVCFAAEESVWDSLKKDFKSAGSSIKDSAKSIGSDIKQGVNEIANEKGNDIKEGVKNTAKDTAKGIADAAKDLATSVENNKTVTVTGTLKQGLFSKTKFTLNADDGNLYTLKTLSGSDDSYAKLSELKNKKIKVSGILDKKENIITMSNYKLAN